LGGKSLRVCEKVSDFLTKNAARGASFRYIRDRELEDICSNFAKLFGYVDFLGIDIVKTKDNKIYLLEVNFYPGFSEFEKASGINISQKIIEYCLGEYNKK